VTLKVENNESDYTRLCKKNQDLRMIIAHGMGNYFAEKEILKEIEGEGRVAFRYRENPNGSINDIAGIFNKKGNVLGMMPHPEDASEELHGSMDGRFLFDSVAEALAA
jgi:phosphoribosylformylglycinamidine synthase